jgi:hypothetical protein
MFPGWIDAVKCPVRAHHGAFEKAAGRKEVLAARAALFLVAKFPAAQ